MVKVSIIIPTYNRFQYLMNTIDSIKKQTYNDIEIIVVNDRSTQKEYYIYDWITNNVKILHLEKNSKDIFGYVKVLRKLMVIILLFVMMTIYGFLKN